MIRGYGLEHHLDGTQPIPERFLGENQLNPLYQNWRGRGRNRGNGNGKRGRGRGGYFASPSPPGRAFSTSVQTVATNNQFYNRVTQAAPRDNSTISCCNCGGLGHVSRVFHSPRTRNANCGVNKPSFNLASTSSQQSQSWLMDSGPTHHLTANFDNLAIHSEYQGPEEVVPGNVSKLPISHIGSSSFHVPGASFNLNNILCIPTAKQNLVSDLATKALLFKCPNEEGHYTLPASPLQSPVQSYSATLGDWHARFGHASPSIVRLSEYSAPGPLNLICSDVWGPAPEISNDVRLGKGVSSLAFLFAHTWDNTTCFLSIYP
ncbi:hypothetical protein KY284_035759 [Solanum tuberosum]|nr:hypothetical protein KY284_035759 [Solanum tuberosum]